LDVAVLSVVLVLVIDLFELHLAIGKRKSVKRQTETHLLTWH